MIKLIMIYVAFIRPEFSHNYCGGPALHVIEAWSNWASSFVQSLLATFLLGMIRVRLRQQPRRIILWELLFKRKLWLQTRMTFTRGKSLQQATIAKPHGTIQSSWEILQIPVAQWETSHVRKDS